MLHFNLFSTKNDADFKEQLEAISEHVSNCLTKAKSEAEAIGKQLQQNEASFSALLRQANYPTFVYRGARLIFWSDHTIIPDLDFPPSPLKVSTAQNEYGKFIVVPRVTGNYTVFIYIPLQVDYRISNNYLSSQLDKEIFDNAQVGLYLNKQAGLPQVVTSDGEFLFAVDFTQAKHKTASTPLQLIFLVTGVVFFVLFSIAICRRLIQRRRHNKGVFVLLVLLILLRVSLLLLNLPFAIADLELFDPKLYAASFWSPSIGDLALNLLLLETVAGAALYLFRKNRILAQLKTIDQEHSRNLQIGCILFFYLLTVMLFNFYYGIYHNSPLILDVTQSLVFSRYKVAMYGVMLLHTIALCAFTYMLATVVTVLLQNEPKKWPYQMLGAIVGVLLLLTGAFIPQLIGVILIGLLFWLIIFFSAQRQSVVNFPYRTYLFVFLVIIVSALTGAFAIFTHYQSELKLYKQEFASNILQENDVLGEFMLESVADRIASDKLIRTKMMGPYVDASFIKRKISRQYLPGYFDKYEVDVHLFDNQGRPLESTAPTATTLQELLQKYDRPDTRTERRNLLLIKDPTRFNVRVYLQFIQVPIGRWQKGTIVLQLTLKKLLPNSLVPELLVNQRSNKTFRADMLSYAIYDHGQLKYSEGEYDYAINFNRSFLRRADLIRQGITQDDFHHYGVIDEDNGQMLIITTENYGGRELLSNFSFLFLAFTVGVVLCGLLYLLIERSRLRSFSPNFSTKIQIFLNFGIMLPLLLVSITTAGLVTASYRKDLMSTYEQRGEAVRENLTQFVTRDQITRNVLQDKVAEIAAIAEADVNVYDRFGKLLVTSQPLIFEAGLLSKLVNPEAYAAISERQALRSMLEERAGSLTFNSVYLPLRQTNNSGELLGFIGIPFFDSEKQLDLKLIELITTTMNIFTIMFIMFMTLTFFASRVLTVPLRVLADKLKRTSLTGQNETLTYAGTDEIGMLVNEYNRMLLTLEQNKVDLAMQEKEAAWREMARQVAHEIKNPLTPMKLSLQYLQKAIAEKRPNTEQLIDKISHTLITQINILNDIATSFSSFTSMPEPKNERMDITAALQRASDLHNDPATAEVITAIPKEEIVVMADENLLVRTFNNLLLNAIQAVPASRKPQIRVAMEVKPDHSVLISIQDNGSGIPEEIRSKVFIPNFSTKYTGSGIGLAVAKRGIENAGGRVWFETEEGSGTTFYISLPLAEP
ncbi:ATP-binding protein [Pontibacter silvestris]|uniref:histidine kinase n=1 Tax=Pontibacter silvestris TaxID=2305183 RepID=A0ABW4X1G1_9BACT|nr:HAMP domain-containing sensor histidine kinase [Pontibacter silvestris]MCC9138283.1 HAMP domain-containing histidine kinase [Pontibacter silvestris]